VGAFLGGSLVVPVPVAAHAGFTTTAAPATTAPPGTGVVYLSSLTPSSATNGLGPYERNRDNGGAAANDGGPISINGVGSTKGIGTYANGTLAYVFAKGQYARFVADVGIDDSACASASVTFEVKVNGAVVAPLDSVVRRKGTPVKRVDVSVANATSLKLVTSGAGNGAACDMLDWAAARLTKTTTVPPTTVAPTTVPPTTVAPTTVPPTTVPPSGSTTFVTDLTPSSSTNGYGAIGRDLSTGQLPIRLNGVPYARGLGAHAISDVRYALGGRHQTFFADVGIDDECPDDTVGTVVFQVFVDGVKAYDSGTMRPTTATKQVGVSVAGANELRLVVGDTGDNNFCDHGDWASARLVATSTTPPPVDVPGGFAEGSWIRLSSDADLARTLDGMAAAGATYARIDVDWWAVQGGGPTSWDWSPIDRLVDGIRARAMRVLGILDYTPPWARPAGTSGKHPPTNVADYANFVTAAVSRYFPRGVRDWEVWNEPNTHWFWEPSPDPAAYTALLKAAYPAIKAIDPGATVVTGGLSPAPDAADGSLMSPVAFLQGVYASGGRGYFDAVGHHPSNWPYMPLRPEPSSYNDNAFGGVAPVLYQTMQANGDGAKKIWATEMGAPTPWQGSDANYLSAYLVEAFTAWDNWAFTGPLIWYSYRDGGTDLGDVEQHFGVVSRDFTPKGTALVTVTALLGG
jgi:hypothetical protein